MKHLLSLALLGASAALLTAQTEQTIIDRSQQPGTPARPETPATSSVAPGDVDSGTQRIAESRKLPFKLNFAYDSQVYHSNNIRLAASGTPEQDAVIFANTLALRAEFASHAIGEGLLTPSVGFTYQRFYHGVGENNFKDLDFDSYSVPLSLRYRFGKNWEATAGLTANSVYSLAEYHLIYRSYSPGLGLRKLISLGENQILSLGGNLSYSLTKADRDSTPAGFSAFRDDRNDKWDASVDAAYYYLHGKWVAGPYVRLAYTDYLHYHETSVLPLAATTVDRRDITGSVGLSVSYNFTDWASARLFTNFDWRDSQGDRAFDYGYANTNAGLGLTLSASY